MTRPILSYSEVKARLGDSLAAFNRLVGQIRYYYELDEVWQAGNINHKHHSNLYFKYGSKTLITVCLRDNYFIAYTVLGKDERAKFDLSRDTFSDCVKTEYNTAEVYHDGKWLSFDIKDESIVDDVFKLLQSKFKPNRKELPQSLDKCMQLDLGLSKQEITKVVVH